MPHLHILTPHVQHNDKPLQWQISEDNKQAVLVACSEDLAKENDMSDGDVKQVFNNINTHYEKNDPKLLSIFEYTNSEELATNNNFSSLPTFQCTNTILINDLALLKGLFHNNTPTTSSITPQVIFSADDETVDIPVPQDWQRPQLATALTHYTLDCPNNFTEEDRDKILTRLAQMSAAKSKTLTLEKSVYDKLLKNQGVSRTLEMLRGDSNNNNNNNTTILMKNVIQTTQTSLDKLFYQLAEHVTNTKTLEDVIVRMLCLYPADHIDYTEILIDVDENHIPRILDTIDAIRVWITGAHPLLAKLPPPTKTELMRTATQFLLQKKESLVRRSLSELEHSQGDLNDLNAILEERFEKYKAKMDETQSMLNLITSYRKLGENHNALLAQRSNKRQSIVQEDSDTETKKQKTSEWSSMPTRQEVIENSRGNNNGIRIIPLTIPKPDQSTQAPVEVKPPSL